MLVTVLSNDLLLPELNNAVSVFKQELEPDLLIQGELQYVDESSYLIYPKYVGIVSTLEKKALPLSCLTGKTLFKYSRNVGDTGLTFGLSIYQPQAPKKSVIVNCVTFGKTGELIKKYATDSPLCVTGKISFELYEGKVRPKMLVTGFTFLPVAKANNQSNTTEAAVKPAVDESHIPF